MKRTGNKSPPASGTPKPAPAHAAKLRAQTRRILGKHYASKYRAGSR